jgi:hypothetical protein
MIVEKAIEHGADKGEVLFAFKEGGGDRPNLKCVLRRHNPVCEVIKPPGVSA